MSIENKRLWFRRYKNQKNIIKRLEDRLESIEKRIPSTHFAPSAGTGLPLRRSSITENDLIEDKLETEARIQRAKAKARSIRRELQEVIDSIENVNLSEVLEYRYIEILEPDEIAEVIGYTPRHIMRLLSQALEEVEIPGLEDSETTGQITDLNPVKSLEP